MRSYSTLGDMSEIHQEAERVTSGVQVIVDLSAMLRGQLEQPISLYTSKQAPMML